MSRPSGIPQSRKNLIPFFEKNARTASITHATRVKPRKVQYWRKRFREDPTLADRPRKGRPRKTTPADDVWLKRTVRRHPTISSAKLSVRMRSSRHVALAPSTIRTRLVAAGLLSRRQARKPALTKGQKLARLKFAQEHQSTDWRNWMFTDETGVYLEAPRKRARVPRGQLCHVPRVAHPPKTNVWVGMTAYGLTSYAIYREDLDAPRYLGILKTHLIQSARRLFPHNRQRFWTFQQDNHPTHCSKLVTTWLKEQDIRTEKWPGSSPDLYPIENFFTSLKSRAMESNPRTIDALEDELRWLLEDDDWVSCENYIDSMPDRIQEIIEAQGGPIRH